MSADLTDDVSTLAYCPVCSPAGYTAAQYQRYAVPQQQTPLNARQNLDVFHSPDLLDPLPADIGTPAGTPGTLQSNTALRLVSCSAPDLIELSSRPDQPPQQDLDHDHDQQDSDREASAGARVMTSLPRVTDDVICTSRESVVGARLSSSVAVYRTTSDNQRPTLNYQIAL